MFDLSLVIETINDLRTRITRNILCGVCLSNIHTNLHGFSNCKHRVHNECAMLLKTRQCFQCKVNHKD